MISDNSIISFWNLKIIPKNPLMLIPILLAELKYKLQDVNNKIHKQKTNQILQFVF